MNKRVKLGARQTRCQYAISIWVLVANCCLRRETCVHPIEFTLRPFSVTNGTTVRWANPALPPLLPPCQLQFDATPEQSAVMWWWHTV